MHLKPYCLSDDNVICIHVYVTTRPGHDRVYCFLSLTYIILYTLAGPNKVSFLISNYTNTSEHATKDNQLISPSLKTRLYNQEPLRTYLDGDHVMSWSDEPNELQAKRLVELAYTEFNPQSLLMNAPCQLL